MHIIELISDILWSLFLPFIIIAGLYMIFKFFSKVKKQTTSKSGVKISQIIGPVAISLGAMIGTGAIIGVLGSIASLKIAGQNYVEAIVGWSILASVILVPISYIETVVAKTTNMSPKEYVAKFLNPKLGAIYGISFIIMYIFGFGGFQFQGINSTITIITNNFIDGGQLSLIQRYLFIVIPLLIFVSLIVITKKHKLFISVMAYCIGIAVSLYLLFLIIFTFKTFDYIPVFFSNMLEGMKNPITFLLGVPTGMILSFRRVIQTSEPGLGALAMSSLESDSKPRTAGVISVGTSTLTIFISIITTTYLTSYGSAQGIIDLSSTDTLVLLDGFFNTGYEVVGLFGILTMMTFTILSGVTTLLGSYYFLSMLLNLEENVEIFIYILLLFIAGTLAIFGGGIIFDAVDLLLFVVAGINILALTTYVYKYYKDYIKK